MIVMTQKQFEKKMDRMMCEREERERFYRRFDELDRQICELRVQLHELKMQIDPEYRRQNTPTCGSDLASVPCITTAR